MEARIAGSEQIVDFEASGLPALYYAADEISVKSQRTYLRLFLGVLALTVTTPAMIVLGFVFSSIAQPLRWAAALSLVASLLLTTKIKQDQEQRTWYGARAVAESVKTSAWRYAMCAEPFVSSLGSAWADGLFLEKLSEILHDRKSLNFSAAADANSRAQITPEMRRLRAGAWQDRLSLYIKQRIQGQRSWYSKKAQFSAGRESTYFVGILFLQLIALAVAFVFASSSSIHVNVTTVFTTATAALLAWLQVRRFQETSQSYAVTTHELGIVEASAENISSESAFSVFVADAENAMSREHTLWAARRDAR